MKNRQPSVEQTPGEVNPAVSIKTIERLQKAGFYGVSTHDRPPVDEFARYMEQRGENIFTVGMLELGALYKDFVTGSVETEMK